MAALLPPDRPLREAFPVRFASPTRWRDDDLFGHMNNVVYYEYFDTAVNRWLVEGARFDVLRGPVIGLVGETACRYFAAVGFPQTVETGLRVERAGTSSVTYRLALFGAGAEAAAVCRYVHVYVDRETRRPAPLPQAFRDALATIS
ncbi:acyl-CoA thioesterase [Rubrimonas cliftonensis]|uniref:Acyl-CoA thioester hydrolase n=1 Tax=Rubrimonas cliftonensis TaxID=89524 RepID=A0A1H3X526_9RHOB|nr:thioesterase family protein [Rubrimonas cliftonensis]SDZ94343.1 acyl-CoA thioester hydrolase [Rubrimonas cliftonensis]